MQDDEPVHDAHFYRSQAAKARQLSRLVHDTAVSAELWTIASRYDDVAEDLDTGAGRLRHPDLLAKRQL